MKSQEPTREELDAFARVLCHTPDTDEPGGVTIEVPVTLTAEEWTLLADINSLQRIVDVTKASDFGAIISNVLMETNLCEIKERLRAEQEKATLRGCVQ